MILRHYGPRGPTNAARPWYALRDHLQLALFTEAERDQDQRNHDALAVRLVELPDEVERETRMIRERYADPQPRLFPIAVTFLVPEGLV